MKLASVFMSAILLAVVLISCEKKPEAYTLRVRLSPGDKLGYQYSFITDGGEQGMTEATQIAFRVKSSVKDDLAVEADLIRTKSTGVVFDEFVTYDSAQPEDEMSGQASETHAILKPLLDSITMFRMTNRGEITQYFHFEGGAQADAPVDLSSMFIQFPEQPVSKGFTWKYQTKGGMLDSKKEMEMKVVECNQDSCVLQMNGVVKGIEGILPDQKLTGKYVIDTATGALRHGAYSSSGYSGVTATVRVESVPLAE